MRGSTPGAAEEHYSPQAAYAVSSLAHSDAFCSWQVPKLPCLHITLLRGLAFPPLAHSIQAASAGPGHAADLLLVLLAGAGMSSACLACQAWGCGATSCTLPAELTPSRHHLLVLASIGPVPAAAGMSTDAFSDFVVGYGEIWCANLFSAYLKSIGVNCAFMDTRTVLVGLQC